ncbi:MAG: LPS export ABC transporter permease LptF [Desulfopila sp.]
MIIDRYLIREIIKPALTICVVLVCIFGCYIATRYGEDALQGSLPGLAVLQLVGLRIVIALEVLLPTTLYFSVVIALSRLYRDGELVAMFACGISLAQVVRAVCLVALVGSILVGCLSLFLRPWAWNQFFAVKAVAKASFDLTRVRGGNFYSSGNRIIFADEVEQQQGVARRVFIRTERPQSLQIISAARARQYTDGNSGEPVLHLEDGHLYEFSALADKGLILDFAGSTMPLAPKEAVESTYRVKSVSTRDLLGSDRLDELAELQWRLIAPISTLLLALIGVPLSRVGPRHGKNTNFIAAIGIFAVYYNFSALAKKWVAQGVLPVLPGLWWGQILLAILVGLLFWWPLWLRTGHRR